MTGQLFTDLHLGDCPLLVLHGGQSPGPPGHKYGYGSGHGDGDGHGYGRAQGHGSGNGYGRVYWSALAPSAPALEVLDSESEDKNMSEWNEKAREIISREAAKIRGQIDPRSQLAMDYEKAGPSRYAMDEALVYLQHKVAGPSLKKYPSPRIGSLFLLGRKLEHLAPELTKKERLAWIGQSKFENVEDWYRASVVSKHGLEGDAYVHHGGVEVWRWVDAALSDAKRRPALLRDNRMHRIDELTPQDLVKSVSDTFHNAEERAAKNAWDGPDELIKPKPWHATLPEGLKVLTTVVELFREGRECSHCVASYARSVYSGECLIVQVKAGNSRSTAEIRGPRVHQHRGPRNSDPAPECKALLESVSWGTLRSS